MVQLHRIPSQALVALLEAAQDHNTLSLDAFYFFVSTFDLGIFAPMQFFLLAQ
jgi:hypothetical protein